jgi:hypothetical protein
MTKPKLLWCGDIVAMTGFARVTENVLQRICDQYEVVVLSHNWWGDPTPLQAKYKMYPSSNRFQTAPFGEDRIREVVEKEKPDIVFTINDMSSTSALKICTIKNYLSLWDMLPWIRMAGQVA